MGVGMPQALRLAQFGDDVRAAFGEVAYHVGSSLMQKDGWRDVDVRVLLSDEDWDAQGFGPSRDVHTNAKWRAITLAWSAYGRALTGLPIDFQLQRRTDANREFPKNRSALFTVTVTPGDHR